MSILDTFTPSEYEAPIREVAERFLAGLSSTGPAREAFSASVWSEMAGLGWHGVAVSEDYGGAGMGIDAALAIAGELGGGLLAEPFVESSILAAGILEAVATHEPAAQLLRGLCDGSRIAAFAHQRTRPAKGRARASVAGGVFALSGTYPLINAGSFTSDFVVLANLGREVGDVPALFIVPANATGLTLQEYRSVDGRALSDVTLEGVEVPANAMIAEGAKAAAIVERALLRESAALAAEAIGAMDRAGELTRDYLRERRQFGQPLASFQALQHYVAEMHAGTELARTMAMMLKDAAIRDGDGGGLKLRALATVSRTARTVGERSIQLHGGMGMTEDMQIGRYFKRLLYLSAAMGGETALAGALAQTIGAEIRQLSGETS